MTAYSITSSVVMPYSPYMSATSSIISPYVDMSQAGNAYLSGKVNTKKYTVKVTSDDGTETEKEITQPQFVPAFPLGATVYTAGPPTLPYSLDLNNDMDIHRRFTKYFMYKALDKWLQKGGSLFDITKKCKLSGNNLMYGREQSGMSQDTIDKLLIYLENYVVTYDFVKRVLKMIVKEAKINWYDFHKHEDLVKELLKKSIIVKLKGN